MSEYFDDTDEEPDTCPLCGSEVSGHNPDVQDLQDARRQMQQQLQLVQIKRPALTTAIDDVQSRIRLIQQEIRQVKTDIQTLLDEQDQSVQTQIPRQRIASFLGGVKMYMRLAPISEDSLSGLRQDLAEIESEIDELLALVEDAEGVDKLETAIAEINSYMTEYGSQIGEEYRGAFFRFDLKKLTVFISQRGDIREFGRNVGSDKNYLQIHLILYLALQRYFTRNNCPVPQFLIIDQIDRPFYPNDVNYSQLDLDNPEELMNDPDRQALVEVYELFTQVCDNLNIQIIVLQHANFPDDQYQNTVIENWRDGRDLVPEDWVEIEV